MQSTCLAWAMHQIDMSSPTSPSLPVSHYVNFSLKSGAPEFNFIQFLEVPGYLWALKPWSLPKTRTYLHPYPQAPLQALRDAPASSSCMHPWVSAHAVSKPTALAVNLSVFTYFAHTDKLPLNSPHLFQKSKALKEGLLGLQSPGTFYLCQEAKGNHVILADKATMRPGHGSQEMKCS